MANKKLKLLYLAHYLQQETDEDHPKTMKEILSYLESCGITAERKSVYDDIMALRDSYGMDIQTVKGKHYGYFMGERYFQLAELKMLIDVVQASPFLTSSKSLDLIKKLEQLTSHYGAQQLRRQVYVMNRLRTDNETLYYTVDGINWAINNNRQISFQYFNWTPDGQKVYRHNNQVYVTNPVALCVERYYYLVAYDAETESYRHYRVDRMRHLTPLETERVPLPPHFDLGEYTKHIFDMYTGEAVTVRLRMHIDLINAAVDRFGSDAHMHAISGDQFELTAEVVPGPTFFGWLFQFGPKAQLLSPQRAVEDFAAWGQQTFAQYE